MNPPSDTNDSGLHGDDAWIDSVISEHARLGKGDDEFFLQRLESALAKDAGRSKTSTFGTLRVALVAAAACVAVAALILRQDPPEKPRAVAFSQEQAAPQPSAGMRPLETVLPDELIEGTPKPARLPRLIAAPTAAPTLWVPKETQLLSKGKPVTSSDDAPIIGNLALITDGDKDAGEGYYVELLDGLQWVQIDLQQTADIHAIWLWHFHSQQRAYHDVIVQLSDDPQFRNGVTTVYNNDYDNSAKMGKGEDNPYVESRFGILINVGGKAGRYVRLYSQGNTSNEMNHYIEVEVFGVPR